MLFYLEYLSGKTLRLNCAQFPGSHNALTLIRRSNAKLPFLEPSAAPASIDYSLPASPDQRDCLLPIECLAPLHIDCVHFPLTNGTY